MTATRNMTTTTGTGLIFLGLGLLAILSANPAIHAAGVPAMLVGIPFAMLISVSAARAVKRGFAKLIKLS